MLTTAPHLHIRRPSPTTAEFTVTTLPELTITLRILRTILLTLRVTLSLSIALLLHSRWTTCSLAAPYNLHPESPKSLTDIPAYLLALLHASPPGLALAAVAASVPLPLLLPCAAVVCYVVGLRVHSSESLLVLRGLGVQTRESPRSYFASCPTRFIPTEKIQDIFINEAFRGIEVRYYLVVVVEGEEDVVVVFPGLLPRKHIVETVWRGARECLYEKGRPVEEKS